MEAAEADEDDDNQSLIGTMCVTKEGRPGKIAVFDPEDKLLELKIEFTDGQLPMHDWVSGDDVVAYDPDGQNTGEDESEFDGDLNDFPEDDGIGSRYGLVEILGGIGVHSCASDSVMKRATLEQLGYEVRPSSGSKRGQK